MVLNLMLNIGSVFNYDPMKLSVIQFYYRLSKYDIHHKAYKKVVK